MRVNSIFILLLILAGFILVLIPQVNASENSCIDCHKTLTPFIEEQKRFNQIRIQHLERNVSCSLECHEERARSLATANYQQWSESVHALKGVACEACHGGDPKQAAKEKAHINFKNNTDPESPIYYTNVPKTCGKCHAVELDHFKNTMHYQRLRAESRAPSCVTCHQPHSFKILKASELTTFCSVCHNPKDQIAAASVPGDAKQALEKQKEFQEEVFKAKTALAEAKAKGIDVSSARKDLEKAIAVMDDIPSLWHEFNLKDFDRQLQNGIDWAKKAEYKVSGVEPTVPRVPSIGIAMVLVIFGILYLIRKRV